MGQQNSKPIEEIGMVRSINRNRSRVVLDNNTKKDTDDALKWCQGDGISKEYIIDNSNQGWKEKIVSKYALYDDMLKMYEGVWGGLKLDYENLITYIREYKNNTDNTPYDYGKLTDHVESRGIEWSRLHDFREKIYDSVSSFLIKSGYETNSFKKFGSKSRGSDIDITITKDHTDIAYIFAYSLGIFNNFIFEKEINKFDCSGLISGYLSEFQLIFDVVPYSSNGIISIANMDIDSHKKNYGKFINPVTQDENSTSYQVIHKYVCELQSRVYEIIYLILLKKILRELEDVTWGTSKFKEKIIRVVKSSSQKSVVMADYILSFSELDSLTRFKIQLWSSDKSNQFADKIITTDFITLSDIPKYYCANAASWEFYQIIANTVSPEASSAVQTFVTTVLSGQRGLINEVDMQNDLMWISCIENMWSMIHQKKMGSTRKQYKYTMRSLELIYIMMGKTSGLVKMNNSNSILFNPPTPNDNKSLPVVFSNAEISRLRGIDESVDKIIVNNKLDRALDFMFDNIITIFAPTRVRYQIKINNF